MAVKVKGISNLFDDMLDGVVHAASSARREKASPLASRGIGEELISPNPFTTPEKKSGWLNIDAGPHPVSPTKNNLNVEMEYSYRKKDPMSEYDRPKYIPPAKKQKTSFLGRISSGDIAGKDFSLSTNRYSVKGSPRTKNGSKAKSYVFDDTEYDIPVLKDTRGMNDGTRHKPYDLPDSEPAIRIPGQNDGTRYKPFELSDAEASMPLSNNSPGVVDTSKEVIKGGVTPGFGGMNSMLGGALIGGGVSYLGSTPENRNFGTFVKGAAFGAAGGAVVSAIGSRGMMSAGSGYAHGVSKKLGFGEGFTENIVNTAQKMESAQHRGMLFASGAMLAGGMFGTNRNRAQGLNSTRGNRFGG